MNQDQNQTDKQAVRKNRIKFLVIVALFILPVALAIYLKVSGWRPASTINYGTLVTPARPLPRLTFDTRDPKALMEKWSLVIVTGTDCEKRCQDNLHAMRQIHVSQGKNQHRVQRVLIHTGNITALGKIGEDYPDLRILRVDGASFPTLQNWVSIDGQNNTLSGSRVFMVDPLGNYMMYYAVGSDPSKMRRDLARLLRVSHIG